MKQHVRILFVCLTGIVLATQAHGQIEVPPVEGGDVSPPNVMVLEPYIESTFTNQDEVQSEIYDLFVYDLQFSGVFNVLEETSQAAYLKEQDREQERVDFSAWNQLEVQGNPLDYVVKTDLIPRGPGHLQLDLYVYDVQQGQRIIGTAFGQDPPFERKQLRQYGHAATAEIITTLTNGEVEPITQTQIMFVNHRPSERTKELFVMDYDGWEDSIRQLTFFESITIFPDWSPNGEEVAYVSYKDGWPDAFIHNLTTGNVSTLARFKGTNTTPRWFPNGERLAISLSGEGNPEIYIIPKNGDDPERITNNPAIDQAPDVSPSGDRIAFISDRIGSPQVYVMNTDGSNMRRISFIQRSCETPMWSPVRFGEEPRIAFTGHSFNLQADIYTVNPDGTDEQQITSGQYDNQNATWSPNGQYLIFSSNRQGGKHEIYITSSDPDENLPNGKEFHRLTYLQGDNFSPIWSPQ